MSSSLGRLFFLDPEFPEEPSTAPIEKPMLWPEEKEKDEEDEEEEAAVGGKGRNSDIVRAPRVPYSTTPP